MDYSILMSVYAKEKPEYLRSSIQSMLNQTIRSNDFVIVCDGPLTEELYAVLEEFESKPENCIHKIQLEENRGLGIALNKGLEICKNELIARMDSDDIALSNRIEIQLQSFLKAKGLAICGSYLEEFKEEIHDCKIIKKVPLTNEEIRSYVKKRNPFNHMTVMFKKAIIQECGSYQDCYLNEDYYLWARVISKGYMTENIAKILVYMRTGNGMYRRRGGLKYIKADILMQRNLYRLKLTSFFSAILNSVMRSLIRIVPNKIREKVYVLFLRGGKGC